MSQVVIGTAGHIDHGKTALVKALTGTDTDRLRQEKERGMTIDLGFAFLTDDITIIDVPGHEKFIRNMVAGVTTVDIALVTVAADDGIMPQTREHIDILRLLGIPLGCIAITKMDLAEDSEWLDLLEEDVHEYVAGSFLERAPIVRVSAETGEGVEELRRSLITLAGEAVARKDRGFFRLFVDRSFSMKGIGTVVTGTVASGSLREGDEVEILPGTLVKKVRGLQSHEKKVLSVVLGDRAAVNLSNVNRSAIRRGSQLVTEGFMDTTGRMGAEISLLSRTERVIRHQQRVRLHVGTDEVMARVFLVSSDKQKTLQPGESGTALFRLDREIPLAMDDALILRFYSPTETIGGGVVIDTDPPARWNICRKWLGSLAGSTREDRMEKFLQASAKKPLTLREWSRRWQLSSAIVRQLFDRLETVEFGDSDNPFVVTGTAVTDQKSRTLSALDDFHSRHPYKKGFPADELRHQLGLSAPLFDFLSEALKVEGRIDVAQGIVRRHGFRIELNEGDKVLAQTVERELKEAAFTPPTVDTLAGNLGLADSRMLQILHVLKDQGKAVDVARDLWFHGDSLISMENDVRAFLREHSSLAVSDFKTMTRTTRKHAIPLLEYLDKRKVTRREGDSRVLWS